MYVYPHIFLWFLDFFLSTFVNILAYSLIPFFFSFIFFLNMIKFVTLTDSHYNFTCTISNSFILGSPHACWLKCILISSFE